MVTPKKKNLLEMGHHPCLTQMEGSQGKEEGFVNQICHGVSARERSPLRILAASNLPASSGGSIMTSNLPNCISNSHLEHHEGYPCLNGSMSSREKQLISTKSYRCSIARECYGFPVDFMGFYIYWLIALFPELIVKKNYANW